MTVTSPGTSSLLTSTQCEYRVEDLDDGESPKPYQCFCVDRLGMRIRGTEKVDPSDPNACVNKPGECPYLTYVEEDSDSPNVGVNILEKYQKH